MMIDMYGVRKVSGQVP